MIDPRPRTDLWVKAYLRRCFSAGLTGVISQKGAPEAGAVFVRIFIDATSVVLLSAPPGQTYDEAGERRWYSVSGDAPMSAGDADDFIAKQRKFDPDIWVVDIDDRSGTGLLEFDD